MRWLLKVNAEYLKSRTGSAVTARRHGTSAGAGLPAGRLVALAGFDLLAEHRAPLLLDGKAVPAEHAAPDRREDERARAAALDADVGQLRLAADGVADMQRPLEAHALAGEHAPRQRHRRHHAGIARTAVGAQFVGAEARQEIEREPCRRQRVFSAELGFRPPQRQPQEIGRPRMDDVGPAEPPADVSSQILDGERGRHRQRPRKTGARFSANARMPSAASSVSKQMFCAMVSFWSDARRSSSALA